METEDEKFCETCGGCLICDGHEHENGKHCSCRPWYSEFEIESANLESFEIGLNHSKNKAIISIFDGESAMFITEDVSVIEKSIQN